jgi:hypothetical protein
MAFSSGPIRTTHRHILPLVLRSRLKGPGGCYNLGNVVGLGVGLALQVKATPDLASMGQFFAGSNAALALTLANLVFIWSGEIYHRAWAQGALPDAALNRRGDMLSGIGAIALGLGLLLLGQPVLALFSGLLHALGKFGSAADVGHLVSTWLWPKHWPDLCRTAVLLSRAPAVAAAVVLLTHAATGADLIASAALLASYLLWSTADLMLFRSAA